MGRNKVGNVKETIITILLAVSIGLIQEHNKSKLIGIPIKDGLVKLYELNEEYQCPFYCEVDHIHKVHYNDKKCNKCNHFVINRDENYQRNKILMRK